MLDGKACFDGPECPVYTRLATHNSMIYLDLANDHWQAVKVTTTGWQIVTDPPVKFRRTRGMLPLPAPMAVGVCSSTGLRVDVSRLHHRIQRRARGVP